MKNFLIPFLFIFLSCKKDKTGIHGRVVNFITKAPISAKVELFSGNNSPGYKGSKDFGGTSTNRNGTFSFNSSVGSGLYYLEVTPQNYAATTTSISLTKNLDNDIGDILMGDYTFYCKVTLNSVTGSAIDFSDPATFHFNAGTSTQFITHKLFDYDSYTQLNHQYHIGYTTYPNGIAKDTDVFILINSSDTLQTTINY